MAFDYTTAGTGLFVHLGKIIKHINLLGTDETNLDADLDEIQDSFESGDQTDHIELLGADFEGLQSSIVSLRESLAGYAENRIADRTTVINELNLPDDNLDTILDALISQMNDDSESVDGSTVTIGAVSADAGNTGNGTVLTTKVLDGISEPGQNMPAHIEYDGLNSELAVPSETHTVLCVGDADTDGLTSGEESFDWYGEISNTSPWSTDAEGSGRGPNVQVINAGTIIDNRNLENYGTADTPDNWDIDSGTAGTHINEVTAAANVYRGSSSLSFDGDGAQATIQISQDVLAAELDPRRQYCFSIRYKASAIDTVAQTLTIQFEGTGYTASSTEKITVTGDNFDTTWTLKHFFINMPADIPDDFEIVIKITGTLNAAKIVYFDSIGFSPVDYHGGIGMVVVAGATPFVRGDKFTFAVSNDQAGTFQEFARRQWGRQLPSNTGGTETIDDALAA